MIIPINRQQKLAKWNKGKYFWHIFDDREAAIVRKQFSNHLASINLTPAEYAVINCLMHRTLDQNKAAEFVYIEHVTDRTGLSRRTVMYAIKGLKDHGLISRIVLNGQPKSGSYIVNYDKIDAVLGRDVSATVANYMRWERERLSFFSVIDNNWCNRCTNVGKIGAIGAPLHRIINIKEDNLQNKHSPRKPSASRRPVLRVVSNNTEEDMAKFDLDAVMAKSDAAKAKKLEKAAASGKLDPAAVRLVWQSAVAEVYPGAECSTELGEKDSYRVRSKLMTSVRDAKVALEFLDWSLREWRRVMEANSYWLRDAPEYPNVKSFLGLSFLFLECYLDREALSKSLKRNHMAPDERLEATLKDRGYHPAEIEEIVGKARKKMERHDESLKALANSRRLYEAAKMIRSESNRTLQLAALETRKMIEKAAKEMGIDPAALKKQKRDAEPPKFTIGPDGKQYPAEVEHYMVFPEWQDDPKVLQQKLDEAFFNAVQAYNEAMGIEDEHGQGNIASIKKG